MTLLCHELKMNMKSLWIWAVCVGFSCFGCILLFGGLRDSMEGMAEAYAQMGTFSVALGLDRLNVSTMEGFYATEVALVFAIGGAMFAAMSGAAILSKEEEGHTAEFLHTLPFGRKYIVGWKYAAMTALVVLFDVVCLLWILAGFWMAGETAPWREFWLFHGAQFCMQLEVGSVCFLLSAVSAKKQIGAALGFSVLLYMMDLMCRIVPDLEGLRYVTPYYYANAADIFTQSETETGLVWLGIAVTAVCAVLAGVVYERRDLRS